MYQGAWVYAGLKPGYHSSVMNSSTGMTVAIASPRAGRLRCPEGFTAVSRWQRARSPERNAIGVPRGRTARSRHRRRWLTPPVYCTLRAVPGSRQWSVASRDAERLGVAWGAALAGAGPAHRRRPPVPPAEQHDRGRHQQGADEEGVHQDAQGEARAYVAELGGSLLGAHDGEDGEGTAEHQPRRRDRGPGRDQGAAHRLLQGKTLRFLPDPAHHEDVVVLAQRQQEDEHQEGQEEDQATVPGDLDEQSDGQAERGPVGEPDRDDQVQRRHQAAH